MSMLSELFRGKSVRFILPLVLIMAWILVDFLSIFLGGVITFDVFWVIGLVAKLLMLGANLWFLKHFFLNGRKELYGALRKYAGYAVVLGYGAINLPILNWQAAGTLGSDDGFWLWLLCAIQALLMAALWLSLRVKKSMVFWGVITSEEASDKKLLQQHMRARKRTPLMVVLENVDMFIQTVFIVIVLQIFLVQLYVIPSESMVPTMLDEDRPLVLKTLDGPTIPMSNVKLPELIAVKRGQIVVFESPAYQPPPLGIKVVQEFLFYLTLSLVNLDKDEDGNPKVHYVVKRVTGVPGEKLMMLDDKLYVKTASDSDFQLQEQDLNYGHVDFTNQPENIQKRIWEPMVTPGYKAIFDAWDAIKNSLDIEKSQAALKQQVVGLQRDFAAISPSNLRNFEKIQFSGNTDEMEFRYASLVAQFKNQKLVPWQDAGIYHPLVKTLDSGGTLKNKIVGDNQDDCKKTVQYVDWLIIHHLLVAASARNDLLSFLQSQPAMNPATASSRFEKSAIAVNLLNKQLIAERYRFLLGLIAKNSSAAEYQTNQELAALYQKAWEYVVYLNFFDTRNFAPFPSGKDEYIPANKFFLMGDNRFNSLDFRFDENNSRRTRILEASDLQSVVINDTALAPRLLDRSSIIGHVIFRLFPFDRFGVIKP